MVFLYVLGFTATLHASRWLLSFRSLQQSRLVSELAHALVHHGRTPALVRLLLGEYRPRLLLLLSMGVHCRKHILREYLTVLLEERKAVGPEEVQEVLQVVREIGLKRADVLLDVLREVIEDLDGGWRARAAKEAYRNLGGQLHRTRESSTQGIDRLEHGNMDTMRWDRAKSEASTLLLKRLPRLNSSYHNSFTTTTDSDQNIFPTIASTSTYTNSKNRSTLEYHPVSNKIILIRHHPHLDLGPALVDIDLDTASSDHLLSSQRDTTNTNTTTSHMNTNRNKERNRNRNKNTNHHHHHHHHSGAIHAAGVSLKMKVAFLADLLMRLLLHNNDNNSDSDWDKPSNPSDDIHPHTKNTNHHSLDSPHDIRLFQHSMLTLTHHHDPHHHDDDDDHLSFQQHQHHHHPLAMQHAGGGGASHAFILDALPQYRQLGLSVDQTRCKHAWNKFCTILLFHLPYSAQTVHQLIDSLYARAQVHTTTIQGRASDQHQHHTVLIPTDPTRHIIPQAGRDYDENMDASGSSSVSSTECDSDSASDSDPEENQGAAPIMVRGEYID